MRSLVAVLAALALVAAVVVLLGDDGIELGRTDAPPADGAPTVEGGADTELANDAEGAREEVSARDPLAPDAAGGASAAAEGAPMGSIRVRCVDAVTGEAVPGARVHATDAGTIGDHLAHNHPTPIAALVEHAPGLVADANGEVLLPPPAGRVWLAAIDGDARAYEVVSPPVVDQPFVLELEAERDLVVLVQDADGARLEGVEVAAGVHATDPNADESDAGRTHQVDIVRATTDADGRAVFEWEKLTSWVVWKNAVEGYVRAEIVGSLGVEAAFEVGACPEEPLVLELPGTGSFVFEVSLPDGRPLPGRHRFALWTHLVASSRSVVHEPLIDGVARFDHVVLGGSFIAEATCSGGKLTSAHEVVGPVHAGEVVRVPLTTSGEVVIGRLVDADGTVLTNHGIAIEGGSRARPTSDDAGVFAFSLPMAIVLNGEPRSERHLDLRFVETETRGAVPREAHVVRRLPEAFVGDGIVHDLGDVVLRPPATLVTGSVREPDGTPVPDATVLLMQRDGADWRNAPNQAVTDADGRFAFGSEPSLVERANAGELGLAAQSSTHALQDIVTFGPGEDVELVALRFGAIEGRIEWSGGELSDLIVLATFAEGELAGRTAAQLLIRTDGSFGGPFPAGLWNLEARVMDEGRPVGTIARLDGVRVESGAAAVDARIDPWRVEGRRIAVTVLDADGLEPVSGRAVLCEDGRHVGSESFSNGELVFWAGAAPIDAYLHSRREGGGADLVARDVVDGAVLQLNPSPDLVVRLTGDGRALPDGASIFVHARPLPPIADDAFVVSAGTIGRATELPGELRADGFWATGPLEFTLTVQRPRERGHAFGTPRRVEVAPGPGEQIVDVVLTADEVDEALALLGEE